MSLMVNLIEWIKLKNLESGFRHLDYHQNAPYSSQERLNTCHKGGGGVMGSLKKRFEVKIPTFDSVCLTILAWARTIQIELNSLGSV